MLFRQFSNIITYIRDVGKLPDQHFSVSMFSNPGGKILILVESRGQICPVVFHLFRIFPPGLDNNDTLKCWSGNFPTSLIYMIMLENCQNNISMYCCSPIQEERSWFLLKLNGARISECNISLCKAQEKYAFWMVFRHKVPMCLSKRTQFWAKFVWCKRVRSKWYIT